MNKIFTRFVGLFFGFGLIVSTSARADTSEADALIARQDFAAFEVLASDLHSAHIAGDVEASALRTPFSLFSTTSPNIEPMIDAWLTDMPESPYAHSAATWYYHGRAWRYRGNGLYRFTWPAAIEAFNNDIALSQSHAWAAFDVAPDLVPASDALLLNEKVTGQLRPFGILQLVDAVMGTTPNRGTLYRAASAFQPNWGGDIGVLRNLCDENASLVRSVDNYTVEACVADMVLNMGVRGEMRDAAIEALDAHGWDGFEHHRHTLYTQSVIGGNTGLSHEDVATYLMQDDVWDFALAQRFYTVQFHFHPAPDVDQKVEATQIILRNKDIARAALAADPGNVQILHMILFDTESAVDRAAFPEREELLVMLGEVLHSAPFDHRRWLRVGAAMQTNELYYRAGGMEAFGNSVAYANHSPYSLITVSRQIMPWSSGNFREQPDFDQAEYDIHAVCPSIRVARLLRAVCEGQNGANGCSNATNELERSVPFFEDAEARDICVAERTGALQDIAFYPSDVIVGNYAHAAD